jgi:thiol:disulfide interchange protein DsbC
MPRTTFRLARRTAVLLLLAATGPLFAQEAAIRKALAERIPRLPPIDEVRPSPVPGVFEVRYGGTEILYSDEKGEHIFVGGSLIETRTRTDLTEQRIDKLTAIDFAKLPLKDAITIRQGTGARKMAVFADPNCGYCKRFERDLTTLKDVTIYTFLMPILGPDSNARARDIWCSRDPGKAWRAWMIDGQSAPAAPARCDVAALERNVALGRRHRINGTPAVVFEDGTRKPGALPAEEVERGLAAAARKS